MTVAKKAKAPIGPPTPVVTVPAPKPVTAPAAIVSIEGSVPPAKLPQ